jgi:choline dehydrogenase
VRNSDIHSVTADAGVILAAGTYGSPHLLQVSGIGDPDRLDEVGIEPVVENPEVGLNLQDHPIAGIMHDSLRRGTLDDAENLIELTRWLALRRGRLTSPVAEAGAFVRSSPDVTEPNLEFHFGPASFDDHGRTRHDGHAFTFGPMLVNHASRGSVLARSPDVTDHPVITTNCLTEPQDLEALVRGMEIGRELAAQRPFDDYRGHEIYPGRSVTTRDELVSFIRRRVELLYHPVGTCRMGKDDLAVVDPQLRVNGVDGLRVVDASVMPRIISGNTNAPTLMIADRASEMILGA